MKTILVISATALLTVFASNTALSWSTGIGIIDNNVPKVVKNPEVILKDPVGAVSDLAAKSGCWGCDKIVEKALPEEKRKIANTIITTGFVTTATLGPVGSIITLGVLVASGANAEAEN